MKYFCLLILCCNALEICGQAKSITVDLSELNKKNKIEFPDSVYFRGVQIYKCTGSNIEYSIPDSLWKSVRNETITFFIGSRIYSAKILHDFFTECKQSFIISLYKFKGKKYYSLRNCTSRVDTGILKIKKNKI